MLSTARSGARSLRSFRFPSYCLPVPSSRIRTPQLSLSRLDSLSQTQRAPFSVSWRHYQSAAAQQEIPSSEHEEEMTKFQQLAERGIIDNSVIDVIVNRMNIHTMTDVQRMTLNHCLDGTDVVGQAKTGTGKTIAFLLPIVQKILKDQSLIGRNRTNYRARPDDIRALIISPTRELAEQIAVEARKLIANTQIQIQTAVGGTQKSYHLREMQKRGCHILVGTPGRVLDILQDPMTGVGLDNIETFVLDEADRLLDIGFAPAIEEIQSFMPKREVKSRQTLMFSATIPKSVVSLVRQTMRPDFKFIRTVDPNDTPTHERVPQKIVFAQGLQNVLPVILEIAQTAMEAHKKDPANNMPFKAIVYFGSTNEVSLAYEIFQNFREPGANSMFAPHPLNPCKVYQMSSKLEQRQRTTESTGFRHAASAILFSSDVTARGMDFPNVSHVIQVGPPKAPDDYVHRIGRTGRAGKPGEGWLICSQDDRQAVAQRFRDHHITLQPTSLFTADLDMTKGSQVPAHIARLLQLIESGVRQTSFKTKAAAYNSLFGVLQQQNPSRNKQTQVDMMNDLAKYGWGLAEPPQVAASFAGKIGFSQCDGLNLSRETRHGSGRAPPPQRRGPPRFDENDPFGQGLGTGTGVFGGGFRDNRRDGSFARRR